MTPLVATTAATQIYQVDRAHSEVLFQVRHLLSKVRGRFAEFTGTIDYDAHEPVHSSVSLTIRAASVDTNQADRDAHLRSEDFFAADRFPTLTFRSTRIIARGAQEFDVVGDLTIRDVTKAVVIPVSYLGAAKDPWGNEKLAFEGEITINRKDFGLTWNAALETGGFLVGDDVKVSVSLQAQAQ
jgi:polyisoprenoid-binding protein YceI